MLADDVVLIGDLVAETLGPLRADLKAVQAVVGSLEQRWNDMGAVRERLAVLETRQPIPGPPGPQGERGVQGERGEQGPAVKGEKGDRGEKGDAGLSLKGDPGERGEKGEPGLTVKGERGDRGPIGEPGIGFKGDPGERGATGAKGTDGIGLTDALVNRDGHLVITLSDGTTKDVGVIVGKDGLPGVNGTSVDPLFVQDFLSKELAKWPKPKDGKDGAPGLSPDDFDWDFQPDTRELSITLSRDGKALVTRTKVLKGMRVYRHTFEAGRTYEDGDVVTWNGSEWTALAQTKERPGNGATAWKLTVKHGEKGEQGKPGDPGRPGRDLTNLGPDGAKWGR